jgi:hypothetical protein
MVPQQMMACLLAEIRTNREEMKVDRGERKAEMKAMQQRMDANFKEMTASLEAKLDSSRGLDGGNEILSREEGGQQ